MHGTLDVGFDDIGEQQVKNTARPIRAFSVRFGGADAHAHGADKTSGALPKARGSVSVATALRSTRPVVVLAVIVGAAAAFAVIAYYSLGPLPYRRAPAPPAMSVGVLPLVASAGDPGNGATGGIAYSQPVRANLLTVIIYPNRAGDGEPSQHGEPAWHRRVGPGDPMSGTSWRAKVQPGQGVTETRLRLINGASGSKSGMRPCR